MIASTQLMTTRVGPLVFFHQVHGMKPVIYISIRSNHRKRSHGLPIQITHNKNMSDTMPNLIHLVVLTSEMRSLNDGDLWVVEFDLESTGYSSIN